MVGNLHIVCLKTFFEKIETYETKAALVILLLLVFIDAQRVPFHYVSELCCHHQRDKL